MNGHVWVEHLLTSLPGGQVGFLVFVNILVFLLAFFLDFFEIAFIIIPLIGPAAEKIGIDLIWLGVMLGVNMQTSFMHPPFGFALFYLRGIVSRTRTGKMTDPVTTGRSIGAPCRSWSSSASWSRLRHRPSPQSVMHYKPPTVDPSKIEIQVPTFGKDGGVGLVLPPLGSGFGQGPNIPVPTFPTLPTTGPDLGGAATKAPEATPTEPSAQTKTEEAPKAEEAKPEPKTEAKPETTAQVGGAVAANKKAGSAGALPALSSSDAIRASSCAAGSSCRCRRCSPTAGTRDTGRPARPSWPHRFS